MVTRITIGATLHRMTRVILGTASET
jgi:hypothetical protein